MTPDEMKAKTEGKIAQVKALMKALNLTMNAEEIIDQNSMLKKVVFFYDSEIYPTKNETENPPIQQQEA